MKVDYFLRELEGMTPNEAVDYLEGLMYLQDTPDGEEFYERVVAPLQYLENKRKREILIDFLVLEGKGDYDGAGYHPYNEDDYYDEEDIPYFEDEYDTSYHDYEAWEKHWKQEDSAKKSQWLAAEMDSIEMATEASDREAAEAWVKYGDVLPIKDYNVFTKWVITFYALYGYDYSNNWWKSVPIRWLEEPITEGYEEDYEDTDCPYYSYWQDENNNIDTLDESTLIDELNEDLDDLLKEE